MSPTHKASQEDVTAIRAGAKVMLDRQLHAYDDFAADIARMAGVSIEVANKIVGFYKKIKAVKYDGMRYVVKHGAFLDRDVLLRAAEQIKA